MLQEILFYITIMFANIMQGITGFAGTILAMPFSLKLVGYEVAKPVLNVVGIAAGLYVVIGGYKNINKKQFLKIVLVMACGILCGITIKDALSGKQQILNMGLGIFVTFIGLKGIVTSFFLSKDKKDETQKNDIMAKVTGYILLILAGTIHGIFVSGGPLLITYLTKEIKTKDQFRCTISACWVILNSLILVSDVMSGYYTPDTIRVQIIAIPFLFVGMFIGGKLVKKMSQSVFMRITYCLLLIAGVSLFV